MQKVINSNLEKSILIYQKLEAFIRKYYLNELLRGFIFFVGLGLIYFLCTLFLEYFLWFKPIGRAFLFWIFIAVEIFLFIRFISLPIFRLFKLKAGIDHNQASAIIGTHFVEVKDKLLNFIQLSSAISDSSDSDLLSASIEQKASSLNPIPFNQAINIARNKRFLPIALVPICIIFIIIITGNEAIISQSMNRVVHFNVSFSPPAPFKFVILNSELKTEQGNDFILKIKTVGKVVPENSMIYIEDGSFFMENIGPGEFQFKIVKPSQNIVFHMQANDIVSDKFELEVVDVPSIVNLQMKLKFPAHMRKKEEIVEGTGNAIVPEGTIVRWDIGASGTSKIEYSDKYNELLFTGYNNSFSLSKIILQNTEYQIITSNKDVNGYEKLKYLITVVKDQFPSINVKQAPDSLGLESKFLLGQVGDDYGISKVDIVYYESGRPGTIKRGTIPIKGSTYDRFIFSFPANLPVNDGVLYEYYFEAFDNDIMHNFKSTKSNIFKNYIKTVDEKKEEQLLQQNDNISGLERSVKDQLKQFSVMENIQNSNKEKENFSFKDYQKVDDFVQTQKKLDEMTKSYLEKVGENLHKIDSDHKDELKDELEKKLEKAKKEFDENKKLLDELNELNNKLNEERLIEKLEQLKQNRINQSKNLQQLVELTKKYYIQKKAEQIAEKLMDLSEKQNQLSQDIKEKKLAEQVDIRKEFDKVRKELDEVDRENKTLKSPLDIFKDDKLEDDISKELEKASDNLKNNISKAKSNQKNASDKMKSLSQKLAQSMEQSGVEQMEEDVKMLRQIIDNLLAFSISQEDLMDSFKTINPSSPSLSKYLRLEQDLKLQFKHVDDSLFVIALRNEKFTDDITNEVGAVQYNIDKALESFGDAQISKGVSHQQYVVSGANKLGDFLSNLLNNMQLSLSGGSGMGAGKPKPGGNSGMQLPDIIKKQQGLEKEMGDKVGQNGKSGSEGKQQNGKSSNGREGADGEGTAGEIMEIYKEQMRLRNALENELNKQGNSGLGKNAVDKMKQLERELLNKGFVNSGLQKMRNIKQELLKLQEAMKEQGEDHKRQSATNKSYFSNAVKALPNSLLEYFMSVEILNRQSLPLRSNFNQKVQTYFKTND